jgi:aspartate racemase
MDDDRAASRPAPLTVGVMGGLGPDATLDFFARVLERTPASCDQDHLHLLIDNNPTVPNRNAAVAGTGPSPVPALVEMAKRLERAGADFLVMPCNAAHAFAHAIKQAVSIPFLSIVDETRNEVVRRFPKVRRVGVLASTGCIDSELYQEAFADVSIDVVVPIDADRASFMALLYRIKSGDKSPDVRRSMQNIARRLIDSGAEVIVAGCTEVPLVLDGIDVPRPLINSTDVLVEKTVVTALRGERPN